MKEKGFTLSYDHCFLPDLIYLHHRDQMLSIQMAAVHNFKNRFLVSGFLYFQVFANLRNTTSCAFNTMETLHFIIKIDLFYMQTASLLMREKISIKLS